MGRALRRCGIRCVVCNVGVGAILSRPADSLARGVSPGGGANFVAPVLAQFLSVHLWQAVVVEDRPGSNGNIAGDLVAHAAADCYTVLESAGSLLVAM